MIGIIHRVFYGRRKENSREKKKDGRHNHNLWLPQSVSKQKEKKKKVLTQLRHNYDW